jgi:hypothetical protein
MADAYCQAGQVPVKSSHTVLCTLGSIDSRIKTSGGAKMASATALNASIARFLVFTNSISWAIREYIKIKFKLRTKLVIAWNLPVSAGPIRIQLDQRQSGDKADNRYNSLFRSEVRCRKITPTSPKKLEK